MTKENEHSPLGLMPRSIWERKRMIDIKDAIERYVGAGLSVPEEWITEYNELMRNEPGKIS